MVAVALMAGALVVARSPASVIAIVNELKADGAFTQLVLGVTVVVSTRIHFAVSEGVNVLTNAMHAAVRAGRWTSSW